MLLEEHCIKEEPITEGKTKMILHYFGSIICESGAHMAAPIFSETEVVMFFKDDITAGDGEKKDTIEGKGLIDAITNANIFRYLNKKDIPTHFIDIDKQDSRYQLVKKLQRALPLEVVARRVATGSYLPRNLDTKEGDYFPELEVEFFYKDDELHDPMLDPTHVEVLGKKTPVFEQADDLVRRVFIYLEEAFEKQHHQLIDLKIEVGYPVDSDELVVTDEITGASFRLWPYSDKKATGLITQPGSPVTPNVMDQLNKAGMLDKQLYREGHELTEVKDKFDRIRILTESF